MNQLHRRSWLRNRPRCAGGLLAAALALGVTASSTGTAAAASTPVITVAATLTGTALTPGAVGFSFEASDLPIPGFSSGNLAAYLKTLGTSVVRIGGNTVDSTFWTSSGETPPSWSSATITPADLTAFAKVIKASGWKIILGVNLKHYDAARAADEASYASKAFGSSLQAMEVGNEAGHYVASASYFAEFEAYVKAMRRAVTGIPVEGSDTDGRPTGSLQTAFIAGESGLSKPDVVEVTSHYYALSACGGAHPTMAQLLSPTTLANEKTNADQAVAAASKIHLPAVITEGNSVVCQGEEGVSNVFGSALWQLDEQLVTAREGVVGNYLHGTVLQCNGKKPLFMWYTPLCATSASAAAAGRLTAQPVYYGMAAVHAVGTGTFLNVTNPVSDTVRAYAVKHSDGTITVVLDNVQDPASHAATSLKLDLGAGYTSGSRVDLTGPSLTATSGIRLGGRFVGGNGSLHSPTPTPVTVAGNSVAVSVPAGSAALLTFAR